MSGDRLRHAALRGEYSFQSHSPWAITSTPSSTAMRCMSIAFACATSSRPSLAGLGSHLLQGVLAHHRPVGSFAEAVFDEDLHAARAACGNTRDDRLGGVLSRILAGGQRMVRRVRGLEHRRRQQRLARALIEQQHGIAVLNDGRAAVKQIGGLRLCLECRDALAARTPDPAPELRRSTDSCAAAAARTLHATPRHQVFRYRAAIPALRRHECESPSVRG